VGAGRHTVDASQPTQLVAPGDPSALIVNRGSVTIYVDPDQGNVDTNAFPLAPLASIATGAGATLYAVADPTAPGSQDVYVLPGATAYSPAATEIAGALIGQDLTVTLGGATLNVALVADSAPITLAGTPHVVVDAAPVVHTVVDAAPVVHTVVDSAPVLHTLLDGGQAGAGSQVHTVTP
jgi:hypothetical protein